MDIYRFLGLIKINFLRKKRLFISGCSSDEVRSRFRRWLDLLNLLPTEKPQLCLPTGPSSLNGCYRILKPTLLVDFQTSEQVEYTYAALSSLLGPQMRVDLIF
jgi:hypothetical protein